MRPVLNERIAICFFGIIRNLPAVLPSIETNVIAPANRHGEVFRIAHLFRQSKVVNAHSREDSDINLNDAYQLGCESLTWDEPDSFIDPEFWNRLKAGGDAWNDDFRSLRNLIHQLYSLKKVTAQAMEEGCQTLIFVRPDLRYLDSLDRPLSRILSADEPTVLLPNWSGWKDSFNDRFAIARGEQAIRSYGNRLDRAEDYIRDTGQPLHAESLLRYVLLRYAVRVRKIPTRALRVRADGSIEPEWFAPVWQRRVVGRVQRDFQKMVRIIAGFRESIGSSFGGRR